MAKNTLPVDTVPGDAMSVDTVPKNTMPVDTVPEDTVAISTATSQAALNKSQILNNQYLILDTRFSVVALKY